MGNRHSPQRLGSTLLLATVLAAASSLATAQSVYKWTSPDGQINYSDTPPPGTDLQRIENQLSVIPPPAVPTSPNASGNAATPAVDPLGTLAPTDSAAADPGVQREQLIELCEAQRGVDCTERVDRAINGVGNSIRPDFPVIMLNHDPQGTFRSGGYTPLPIGVEQRPRRLAQLRQHHDVKAAQPGTGAKPRATREPARLSPVR